MINEMRIARRNGGELFYSHLKHVGSERASGREIVRENGAEEASRVDEQ